MTIVEVMRLTQRIRQFVEALEAGEERPGELPGGFLSPSQEALFRRMAPRDQRHSLRVFGRLWEWGYRDGALLMAALLHDIGKAEARLRLWHRVALVLVRGVNPSLAEGLAHGKRGSWRYPFYLLSVHAERGAELAREVGASAEAVALIRAHHRGDGLPEDERLLALRRADRMS